MCRDCGTVWRVWTDLRVAKPAVEWSAAGAARPVRRAPVLDIDRVIDLVAADLPDLTVVQHHDAWPADDEGVWFFRLPDLMTDIQLESSTGMCPFIVEHSGMPSAVDAWTAASVNEAARMVVGYLRAKAAADGGAAAG
jgi:hypothetical protein